jgi:hypothetical protein
MNPSDLPNKLNNTWLMLKISYGLLFLAAGADKFFHLLVNWNQYVNPGILHALRVDYLTLMLFVAAIEVILGILTLTKFTRIGAYGIAIWFFIIVINLVTMGLFLDIAARDVVLAIGAIALAKLTEIKISAKNY